MISWRRADEHGLVRAAGRDRDPEPESAASLAEETRCGGSSESCRGAERSSEIANPNPNPSKPYPESPSSDIAGPRAAMPLEAAADSRVSRRGSGRSPEKARLRPRFWLTCDGGISRRSYAGKEGGGSARLRARPTGGGRAANSSPRRASPEDVFKSSSCRFVPTSNRKILTKDYFDDYLIP